MRFLMSATVATAGLVLLAATFGGGTTAQAAAIPINLVATGAQETPPNSGAGGAVVHLTWDDATRIMTYAVTVTGLSPDQVTAAHFHRGAPGVAGPVIYPLSTVGFTQISGQVTFAATDVADLKAGLFYFNVHSKELPVGFARAQIPASAFASLQPAAPVVPAPVVTAPVTALPSTGSGGFFSTESVLMLLVGLLAVTIGGAGVLAFRTRRID